MSRNVILVPLDGSKQALSAVPIARSLTEVEGLQIHFLHVGESSESEAELRDRLSHQTGLLEGHAVSARAGDPNEAIVPVAQELGAKIIVLCKHCRPHPQHHLGRTATKVLREAHSPVIFVPPERGISSWYLHHILVPHDGTPTTSAALRPAVELAERAGAELLIAHIANFSLRSGEPGTFVSPRYIDQPQHEWPSWASEFLNRLACVCPLGHVPLRILLGHGDPTEEILRLSERHSSDMIVLVWRGSWESPRAGILKEVLSRANCPVLVLRANDES